MNNDDLLLENIFNNINKWLEFSERKNAYIFSLFSLMIIFTPFISKLTSLCLLLKISVCIFYFFYMIIVTFTFLSLFPKTKISENIVENGQNKKTMKKDNLLFFGDISKYSVEEYKNALVEKYKISEKPSSYKDDLITQIIINANIISTKLAFFKASVILACIAIIQFATCFSISLFL